MVLRSACCRRFPSYFRRECSTFGHWDTAQFKPKKAVILTKVSRYEFEKLRHDNLSETQLEQELTARGSNYAAIRHHHNIHKSLEVAVADTLEKAGVEIRIVKRNQEYTDEIVKWADMIVTTGGDGTFLMGASKILDKSKPVIGFNTDPTRSEGHLCLPKHYSFNIEEAVEMLLSGKFRWFFRRRLRISLTGDPAKINLPPVELKEQQLQYPEYRYMDLMNETGCDHPFKESEAEQQEEFTRTLPILALNEIYIGESLSSRVSYLELQIDKEPLFKSRNSGLCISTGTGSTSWIFNINKLTHHAVESLMKIIFETTRFPLNWKDTKLVEAVTSTFNNLIVFDPESPVMCFTLRDPISVGTFPNPSELRPRGKAKKISVKSKCFDACLVVDGSLSFKFNDGTKAVIELLDEDSLRTVQLFREL